MKSLTLSFVALMSFFAAMTADVSDANAVVCARGRYHAGCAGTVHRHHVRVCRWVWVRGARVRRCY